MQLVLQRIESIQLVPRIGDNDGLFQCARANLAYSADGSCVDNVLIDGKIIMNKKEILTVEETEVLQKVKKKAQEIKDRLKLELPSKWKVL